MSCWINSCHYTNTVAVLTATATMCYNTPIKIFISCLCFYDQTAILCVYIMMKSGILWLIITKQHIHFFFSVGKVFRFFIAHHPTSLRHLSLENIRLSNAVHVLTIFLLLKITQADRAKRRKIFFKTKIILTRLLLPSFIKNIVPCRLDWIRWMKRVVKEDKVIWRLLWQRTFLCGSRLPFCCKNVPYFAALAIKYTNCRK